MIQLISSSNPPNHKTNTKNNNPIREWECRRSTPRDANPIIPNPFIPIQKTIILFFKSNLKKKIDYLLNEQWRNQPMIFFFFFILLIKKLFSICYWIWNLSVWLGICQKFKICTKKKTQTHFYNIPGVQKLIQFVGIHEEKIFPNGQSVKELLTL